MRTPPIAQQQQRLRLNYFGWLFRLFLITAAGWWDARIQQVYGSLKGAASQVWASVFRTTTHVCASPGCPAGCNLQDELFASFENVLAMADRRGEPYARIVLENSGIAEPQVSGCLMFPTTQDVYVLAALAFVC